MEKSNNDSNDGGSGDYDDSLYTIREYWRNLVKEMKVFIENGLSLIASCELDGDSNKGITELGFKLMVLCFLGNNLTVYKDLIIESEREVESGRIDIFLYNPVKKTALVIELKYIRIGFLESTKEVYKFGYKEKHKIWEKEDNKISLLNVKDIGNINVRQYTTINMNTNEKEMKLISIRSIWRDASKQATRYCKALREGDIRKIDDNIRLFRVVIIGVGRSVIRVGLYEI